MTSYNNFVRAWKRAKGPALEAKRNDFIPQHYAKRDGGYPAQIIRTQAQESDRTISDTYYQNVKAARDYIYIENQFFRQPRLMDAIAQAAEDLNRWKFKRSLYLFVVCNAPDWDGRRNTYDTLSALGHSEQMPVMDGDPTIKKEAHRPLACTMGGDKAGLQSVICTLTACENRHYLPIYTHSKLMIIDGNFYTLGSANLNDRSMTTDSEINVSVPDQDSATWLRDTLWWMHRGAGLEKDTATNFKKWQKVASLNLQYFQDRSENLDGRLTLFMDNGPVPPAKVAGD